MPPTLTPASYGSVFVFVNGSSNFVSGCTLTKDYPTANWSYTDEDDDTDFMDHTLFLRNVSCILYLCYF